MKAHVLNLPATSGVLVSTGGCLLIHASLETTGSAAAQYNLWDSDTNSGQLLLPVALSAGQSTRDGFRAHHLPFNTGLYYDLVSGAVEGIVSVCDDHRCAEALMMQWHAIMEQAGGHS
jgi:hypothetical protein